MPEHNSAPSAVDAPGQEGAPAAQAPLPLAMLRSRCPRCDVGPLFEGWVKFAPRCRACDLDLSTFNVGDGPAAFLILILGGFVTALALFLQLAASPPFWVHILLWVPITTALVIFSLRVCKAGLLILEYRNNAREGRRTDKAPTSNGPTSNGPTSNGSV